MATRFIRCNAGAFGLHCGFSPPKFIYQQTRSLVNIKLKWKRDRNLDAAVSSDRFVKQACTLMNIISAAPKCSLPIHSLDHLRDELDLPNNLKVSSFIRAFPSIFHESYARDSVGTVVPYFGLTREGLDLRKEEISVVEKNRTDLLNRLRKLLMITTDQVLPLDIIEQLKWDLGLPYDCYDSFIPHDSDVFSFVEISEKRAGLKLESWDDDLAVSELRKNSSKKDDCLAFPVVPSRRCGLRKRCALWLREWQKLPYTSPYSDSSNLDPRTDESEKRIVGVFHEILHLTLQKRTERNNVKNARQWLALPYKYTKVFGRHPAIFYISLRGNTQTVVLRECYKGQKLLQSHPVLKFRKKIARALRQGWSDNKNRLVQRYKPAVIQEKKLKRVWRSVVSRSEDEFDSSNEYNTYDSSRSRYRNDKRFW